MVRAILEYDDQNEILVTPFKMDGEKYIIPYICAVGEVVSSLIAKVSQEDLSRYKQRAIKRGMAETDLLGHGLKAAVYVDANGVPSEQVGIILENGVRILLDMGLAQWYASVTSEYPFTYFHSQEKQGMVVYWADGIVSVASAQVGMYRAARDDLARIRKAYIENTPMNGSCEGDMWLYNPVFHSIVLSSKTSSMTVNPPQHMVEALIRWIDRNVPSGKQ